MNNEITMKTTLKGSDWDSSNDRYPEFSESIKNNFINAIGKGGVLYRTNTSGLFDAYLNNILVDARQHYNCNTCHNFIRKYGGLVIMLEDGSIEPAIWNDDTAPDFFKASSKAMKDIVLKSKVIGPFYSSTLDLGLPEAGGWDHLSVRLPLAMLFSDPDQTTYQAECEKTEEFKMVIRALQRYSLPLVEQAITVLETKKLRGSERVIGVAKWFRDLYNDRYNANNSKNATNLLWRAVVTAPAGFAHLKNNMLGTLLKSLQEGESFETLKAKFDDKMAGDKYMQSTVAPPQGNIDRAETIFEKRGLTPSLERRFADLEEIPEKLWVPKEKVVESTKPSSTFGHLKPKEAKKDEVIPIVIPPTTMTWRKFSEEVLPTADSIEYNVGSIPDNYVGVTTATNADAPPILQWDSLEKRNPFSWYLYNEGSMYYDWNLTTGYTKVTSIFYQPTMWYTEMPHQGKGLIFTLEGAKDINYQFAGNGLFASTLISELHSVRNTIGAYARQAVLGNGENPTACGVMFGDYANWNATFKVTSGDKTLTYKIDRWD